MSTRLAVEFADHLAGLSPETLDASMRSRLDAIIRCALVCIAVGASEERHVLPVDPASTCVELAPSTDVFAAMNYAFFTGTLGAASDLDPLDGAPAHCALPAVASASIAGVLTGADAPAIEAAVLAGVEGGSRVRQSAHGAALGGGFHSVGVCGVVAAAIAAGRVFGLAGPHMANAIGIALSRAGGLSLNNTSTTLGLTHFGWATGHGLEAAWLASNGVAASLDLSRALQILFPGSEVRLDGLLEAPWPNSLDRTFFKTAPTNIYLSYVVAALMERPGEAVASAIDRIEIELPPVGHLDNASPTGTRVCRHSAQAVAATVVVNGRNYRSFATRALDLNGNPTLRRIADCVRVRLDPARSTNLSTTQVRVRVFVNGTCLHDRNLASSALAPWTHESAASIVADLPVRPLVDRLYHADLLEASTLALSQVIAPVMGP